MVSRTELYKQAIKLWGREFQALMLCEEMAELQKAVCKALRVKLPSQPERREKEILKLKDAITEEIADVQLMIEQVEEMFEIPQSAVEAIKAYKLKRLADLIGCTFRESDNVA